MDVKGQLKRATARIADTLSPDAETAAGSDILKTLKKEHDEVKSLLAELEKSETAAQRTALVQKIKHALIPHTKAEETVVYDGVIALRDKDAQVDGYEGYLEHEWAGKTLTRLDGIADATSSEHLATAKVLKELVEHHIKEEESNVWSDVKKYFSDDDRVRMNAAFERAKTHIKVA